MDPRETPWSGKAHPSDVRVSLPVDVSQLLDQEVLAEKRKRGKFSRSAALREALDLWLYSRRRS